MAKRLGQNLRSLRELSGISQDDLAAQSGLNRTTIGLLERGMRKPCIDTVIKLAAALEVSSEDLVRGIEWVPDRVRGRGHYWVDGRLLD